MKLERFASTTQTRRSALRAQPLWLAGVRPVYAGEGIQGDRERSLRQEQSADESGAPLQQSRIDTRA